MYVKASEHLNNADANSLELIASQMKSLSCNNYPIYDGLSENMEGVINYLKGDNSKALKHFLTALAIYSEQEYYQGVNVLLNNIAIIFALVGDYQSSKKYLLRAIDINEKKGMNYYDIFSYNLAEVEVELANYHEAIDILEKLLKKESITLNNISPVSVIGLIISAYNKLGERDQAESWINRGYLALDENRHNDVDQLVFYTSVMEFHLIEGEYEKVISTSKQFNIDDRYRLPDQYDHLEYLCRAYTSTGDYDKAWKYDSILSEIHADDNIVDREEIISLLMIEYEETRNERLQASINREMELNLTRQNVAHKLMITSLIILFAFVILFVILLRIRKLRNRSKEELSIETEKFAAVNRELQKTNKELEKENKLLDTLISVFAHDLINPFQAILGFSKLMVDDFEALDKESMIEYSNMLSETSFQLNQLLINLQSIATIQAGKDKLEMSEINVIPVIHDVLALYRPLAERKKINITANCDKDLTARINPDVLKTVMRNVLNNAIKYSHTGEEVRINVYEEDNLIYISVEDDGVGMDNEVRRNILKGNYLMSKPGTGSEKGSGLGLAICIDLLRMNKGELEIDNRSEQGTGVILKIMKADA
ncbi:MAG: tetratricopeptide repeat-containing sensor histidine kinase [Bacteroidales bacterium]|nr:tetratricopeptide repeat-containing sensor histidine kinase [Bacteroidales bacterium]